MLVIIISKSHNNLSPSYLRQIITSTLNVHAHNLRNSEINYSVCPQTKNWKAKDSLQHYRGSVLWNKIRSLRKSDICIFWKYLSPPWLGKINLVYYKLKKILSYRFFVVYSQNNQGTSKCQCKLFFFNYAKDQDLMQSYGQIWKLTNHMLYLMLWYTGNPNEET